MAPSACRRWVAAGPDGSGWVDGGVFDDGVGQEVVGERLDGGHRGVVGGAVDFDLEPLSLADGAHLAKPQAMACA